ncbi:MAG TPA: PIN domain-containing protein [Gaiellaceae bacterium]|nr:PIN domain-containing protein [Gaiellaceae bacterium]
MSSAEAAEHTLLLDASVWLASLDSDDRHHDPARRLLESAAAGSRLLAALDLTLYEVANIAVVRWRSPADAERLVRLVLLACPTTLERADDALLRAAAEVAARRRLTVYDGAYVAAAHRRGWTLVSGDLQGLVEPGLAVSPAVASTAG